MSALYDRIYRSLLSQSRGNYFPFKEAVIGSMYPIYFWEQYILFRQYKNYCSNERPEALKEFVSEDEFKRAQSYGKDSSILSFINSTFSIIKDTLWLTFDVYPKLWTLAGKIMFRTTGLGPSYEIVQTVFFFQTNSFINSVLRLPFDLYSTFVIEERHGFNKQTLKLFATDWIKGQIIRSILEMPFVTIFFKIISITGSNFVMRLWFFMVISQLILMALYPIVIQPLFNKFTPLGPGELRSAIEALAVRVKFPLSKLFVVDGSKRTGHSNAYFYGFFNNKRIVLFDTLLEHNSTEETCGVLAHELGHWSQNHILKNLVIVMVETYGIFYLFSKIFHNPGLYQSFGFATSANPMVGFLLFGHLYGPIGSLSKVFHNILSRKFEFEADDFARDLGYAEPLSSGLIKLQLKNLGNMNPDWLYCMYHRSHPELMERLNAINDPKAKSE